VIGAVEQLHRIFRYFGLGESIDEPQHRPAATRRAKSVIGCARSARMLKRWT